MRILAVVLAVGFMGAYAYFFLLTRFRWVDDEGFMLMTLRQYLGGRALYDGMYTEFGPFFYATMAGLFSVAGWNVTHDAIRWITLACWLLTSAVWAYSAWLWRHSLAWSLAVFVTAITVLRVLANNPGHPQILFLLLCAAAVAAISLYASHGRPVAFLVVGAAAAGILFMKINLGIFFLAGLALIWISCSDEGLWLKRATALGCAVIPAVLMARHLRSPAVVVQCLLYTFSIAAVALYSIRRRATTLTRRDAAWAAGGFLIAAALTVAAVMAHGTSWTGLVDGVIRNPLRFSGAIQDLHPAPFAVSAFSLAAGALLLWFAERRGGSVMRFQFWIGAGMILAGVFSAETVLWLAPGILWILMPQGPWAGRLPSAVLPVLAATGQLMVFPVPGFDQKGIAVWMMMAAAFAALADASPVLRWRIRLTATTALVGLILLANAVQATRTLSAYRTTPPASGQMPHSKLIRFTPSEYAGYSNLVAGLTAHCGTLATFPGMNSFHIWSGLPHPNGFIISSTMETFDEPAQRRLRSALAAAPRPCVIYNSNLVAWGNGYRSVHPQPFLDFVQNELVLVYSISGYEIRVPPLDAPLWR